MANLLSTKILAIQSSYFNKIEMPKSEQLFHYTRNENVSKIVKKNELRFFMTKSADFRDKNEGRLIENIFADVLASMRTSNVISENIYDLLNGTKPIDKVFINRDKPNAVFDNFDSFVACFTYDGNSDYMWDEYSGEGNDSINISFETFLLNGGSLLIVGDDDSSKQPCFNFNIVNVIYERSKQFGIVYQRVLELVEAFESEADSPQNEALLKVSVASCLKDLRLMFKGESYIQEKETRIIFNLPANDPSRLKSVISVGEKEKKKEKILLRIHSPDGTHKVNSRKDARLFENK